MQVFGLEGQDDRSSGRRHQGHVFYSLEPGSDEALPWGMVRRVLANVEVGDEVSHVLRTIDLRLLVFFDKVIEIRLRDSPKWVTQAIAGEPAHWTSTPLYWQMQSFWHEGGPLLPVRRYGMDAPVSGIGMIQQAWNAIR